MILEVADILIHPGRQADFVRAVHEGLDTVISKSAGFRGYEIRHGIESPERYLLLLQWDSLEDHTVGFRESDLYPRWRALVAPFFARPPAVEHFEPVAS